MTIEELRQRLAEITSRLQEIDSENAGAPLPEEARTEWNDLNAERDQTEELIGELEARSERIAELVAAPAEQRESIADSRFQARRTGVARGDDIWDLSTVRSAADSPAAMRSELHERARRAVEMEARFPARAADRNHVERHVERLLATQDDEHGTIARRILATGSPTYRRAFWKAIAGSPLSPDESRALAIGTGSAGGFGLVYTLDPTIIPTSNLSINPFRRISRVENIAGTNEWRGVTSAGVSAAYANEGTEASDNSPAFAQPAAIVQRAQCFVPFSIEFGQDWGAVETQLGGLIQDAKDDLEATQLVTGTGTPPAPQGILVGATTTVTANGVATFAVADIYKVEEALGPRFRPRAQWLMNRSIMNRIRQFDTAGGANLWMYINQGIDNNPGGNTGAQIIGYPANESSAMPSVLTTGSKIAVFGDFRYYLIVDRIGMDIEVIPHLFGATNRFPTGQRGLYAIWRNTAKVLDANAFRVLVTG